MSAIRAGGQDRHDRDRRDDAGTTLAELLVSMLVLTGFLALFATGFISMTKAVLKQTGVADAQEATRTAFLRLDKQIRYANAVTAPGTGMLISTDQWIEWQVVDPTIAVAQSSTQARCYQWKASPSAGTLQFRTWIVPPVGVAVSTPGWTTVAQGLVIGSQPVFTTATAGLQAAPFSLPTTGQVTNAQVGVSLNVARGSAAGHAAVNTVFTALNANAIPSTTVCHEVLRS